MKHYIVKVNKNTELARLLLRQAELAGYTLNDGTKAKDFSFFGRNYISFNPTNKAYSFHDSILWGEKEVSVLEILEIFNEEKKIILSANKTALYNTNLGELYVEGITLDKSEVKALINKLKEIDDF